MKFIRTPIASLGLAFALGLSFSLSQAQPAPSQPAAHSWSNDPRVQSRTYVFTNTGETLPYAVFVSTKVAKDKPAPLIVALRGYGGNPGVFMYGPALKLAEAGGYIMVAPMGYTSGDNFGNPGGGGDAARTRRRGRLRYIAFALNRTHRVVNDFANLRRLALALMVCQRVSGGNSGPRRTTSTREPLPRSNAQTVSFEAGSGFSFRT